MTTSFSVAVGLLFGVGSTKFRVNGTIMYDHFRKFVVLPHTLLAALLFMASSLQADPIKRALKAIENNQKEQALQKLLLRQLTKDSSNPVYWHAIALCLDNEISKPTTYETYLFSVRCWGVLKDPEKVKN